MLQATVSSAEYPEYGVVTVPFPIPSGEYEHILSLLQTLEIGDAVQQDSTFPHTCTTMRFWNCVSHRNILIRTAPPRAMSVSPRRTV